MSASDGRLETDQLKPVRFGIFISPIHAPSINPTFSLRNDVELIIRLDELGFDEAWVGEHHSSGWEYVGAPDLILAHLISQTRRIRLGTGVISVPYHNPFHVADRMVLLDQLSMGRVMLGVGPGAFPFDAVQLGRDPVQARRMLDEGLEVILALFRGERVTRSTDWFKLEDAFLQLPPYSDPHPEIAVSSLHTPGGPRLAGKYGTGMMMFNPTQQAGFDALNAQWEIVEEQAAEYGQSVSRKNWRLVAPMFIADTEAEARRQVAVGVDRWCYYMKKVATLPILPPSDDTEAAIDALVESGFAVIGTPAQAIAQIERLYDRSGGFGAFLVWANDWATPEATRRSFELLASEVMPRFTPRSSRLLDAESWALQTRKEMVPVAKATRQRAIDDYELERKMQIENKFPPDA
jgi:limonene 1,2-monooxygenase